MTLVRLLCAFAACALLAAPPRPALAQSAWPAAVGASVPPMEGWQDGATDEGVDQVHARKLAGSVHMASEKDTPLATVLVEECDASWSNVLASAKTDYQGHFELKPGRRGKIHYLRLSAAGFTTRQYEVTLSPDAPAELKLELRLAAKSQGGPPRLPPGRFRASRAFAL